MMSEMHKNSAFSLISKYMFLAAADGSTICPVTDWWFFSFRYTGHCPDLADHIGMTYPWATYAILEEKPMLAGRLSSIKAPIKRLMFKPKETLTPEEENDKIIKERRAEQKYPLLGVDISIGYGGHVPKVQEVIGKTHQHVMRKSIAEFERQQREERGGNDRCNCCCHCHCA